MRELLLWLPHSIPLSKDCHISNVRERVVHSLSFPWQFIQPLQHIHHPNAVESSLSEYRGLRTNIANQSKECTRIWWLTHWDDVGLGEIHLSIVGGHPAKTDIIPGFKSWMMLGKLLPRSHEHFKSRDWAWENRICITQHDLLDLVRDLFFH